MAETTPCKKIKAVFFDFMGTCLDWHESITGSLPSRFTEARRSRLALDWRQAFFDEILARYNARLPQEDIDETHRRTLTRLVSSQTHCSEVTLTKDEAETAVRAWHTMAPWQEVKEALRNLRTTCECFVLANGTTRLQLDLVHSSGLQFDMLFSSELLQMTKPDAGIYHRAMQLVGVQPNECVMVAAHAYDLTAAKLVGMRTVYIRRWTEDTQEDMNKIRAENDAFCSDMNTLPSVIASFGNS